MKALKNGGHTVVVVTNFPYRKGTTTEADAVVCNFSGSPDSIRAAADLLFGAIKPYPTTKMPIDLSAEKNLPDQETPPPAKKAAKKACRQNGQRLGAESARAVIHHCGVGWSSGFSRLAAQRLYSSATKTTKEAKAKCLNPLRSTSAISTRSPETKVTAIYEQNKMAVHFQGMSKTLQFPQTVALQGAPTCSIGISPYGLYNRLNDAGRLIMLNQKAVQFGSAPFVRIGDKCTMLTQKQPGETELLDDIPAVKNYYHPPVEEKNVSLTIATPSVEMAYKVGKIKVIRRLISPLLSGNEQTLMPIGVEEFEVQNASKDAQDDHARRAQAVPRQSSGKGAQADGPGQRLYLRPRAVHGQKHEAFRVRRRSRHRHGQLGNPQPHGAGRGRNGRSVRLTSSRISA